MLVEEQKIFLFFNFVVNGLYNCILLMEKYILCESIANEILEDVKKKLENRSVKIALFSSSNPAFSSYERLIYKNAKRFKNLEIIKFSYDTDNKQSVGKIIEDISAVSKDGQIHAIFLESFIQKFLREYNVNFYEYMSYEKDLEAIHPANMGRIFLGEKEHLPPTVSAVLKIISMVKKDLKGLNVVIVNHSEIIGKPLAVALLQSKTNAPTVTVCHIGTKDLQSETKRADILITAIGSPRYFNADFIKDGAIVIDVGYTKLGENFYGDVDIKNVYDKVSLITPVPGGVGLLTISYFFYNIVCCLKKQGVV